MNAFSCTKLTCVVKRKPTEGLMNHPDRCNLEALASLTLTPREAEVLYWISQGKSNQDIGIILGAKTATICKHVEHILGKLNVENRTAAAVIALETYRFVPSASESRPGQAWTAAAIFIMAKFSDVWASAWEMFGEMMCPIA